MIARPNLSYLARGGQTGTLSVSRIATSQLLWRGENAHQGAITHLVWSPDGELLASSGQDGMVHIWRAETGDLLSSFSHDGEVRHLRWSEHGILASSSAAVVHFWSLRERDLAWVREHCAGKPLQSILRHFQLARLEDIRDEDLAAVIKGTYRHKRRQQVS